MNIIAIPLLLCSSQPVGAGQSINAEQDLQKVVTFVKNLGGNIQINANDRDFGKPTISVFDATASSKATWDRYRDMEGLQAYGKMIYVADLQHRLDFWQDRVKAKFGIRLYRNLGFAKDLEALFLAAAKMVPYPTDAKIIPKEMNDE